MTISLLSKPIQMGTVAVGYQVILRGIDVGQGVAYVTVQLLDQNQDNVKQIDQTLTFAEIGLDIPTIVQVAVSRLIGKGILN